MAARGKPHKKHRQRERERGRRPPCPHTVQELRRCFGAWDTEQLQGFSREQLAELLRRLCPELDEAKRKMALRPQRVRPAAGEPRVGGEPAVGRRDDEWTMVSRERVGEQVR